MRLLGVGPVSAAYEVRSGDGDSGEHAVLKLCTVADEEARSLFLRAVYAANRFRHPRVVPIVADGADDQGAPFVIRPWLDARSLAETVGERDIPENQVLRMAEQLLDALEMAHAHGVTHGALTPHNLLLTARGSIRLCDFAMARVMLTRNSGDLVSLTPSVNPGGDRLSELRAGPFTAPERRHAPTSRATESADVWSVGACMYFALTKRAPEAKLSTEGLAQVSKATRDLLEHALQNDPKARYESAYAMLGDVRRAMSGRPPKLALAEKPIPSGGYRAMSMVTPPLGEKVGTALQRIGTPSMTTEAERAQWRGNAALILAIVTLVGVATFVMVREKMADGHNDQSGAPAEMR